MMASGYAVLPDLAVDAVAHALRTGKRRLPEVVDLEPELAVPAATFVTLERDGELLGCIGSLTPDLPLGLSVAHHALGAAFDDPRLPPVTAADFASMSVKVSVLSEPEQLPVDSFDVLVQHLGPTDSAQVGHPEPVGVIIERGNNRATFLPAVWEKIADVDGFLDALWVKAGLPPRWWDAHVLVSTYTTVELTDRGPRAPLGAG
jgi:uncharacterized protein